MPPAVALVLGGMALAFVPGLPTVELNPELALVLFLPPGGADHPGAGRQTVPAMPCDQSADQEPAPSLDRI
jgi:hypothetical protein